LGLQTSLITVFFLARSEKSQSEQTNYSMSKTYFFNFIKRLKKYCSIEFSLLTNLEYFTTNNASIFFGIFVFQIMNGIMPP
jgi:hypothetical protein